MSFPRRLLPALLILALGAAHWAVLRPGHEWGDDFALYLLHARNLVEGRPYADTGYLYNPQYPSIGPPTYPPLTPLLLAPVYALAGLNLEAMKLVMIACFMGFLAAAYLLFRQSLAPFPSAAAVALVGLNAFFLTETNTIGSDELFLALLYLALCLFERADNAPQRQQPWWFVAAGLAAYLAYATRSLGALVVIAFAARELLVRRRLARPALAALGLFALLALAQALLVHSDRRYLDQFGAGPAVLAQHAAWYAERAAAFWSNGHWRLPAILLAAVALLLALFGYLAKARRRLGVTEVFALLYAAAILLWPSYEAERYLYPVLPLWVFYALYALQTAAPRRIAAPATGLLLLAATISCAGRYASRDRGPLAHGIHTPQAQALFQCVVQNTQPADVVLFAKPRAMALMTRRPSAALQISDRDQDLWTSIRALNASWLAVTNRPGVLGRAGNDRLSAGLRAFVARNAAAFQPVCANEHFTLYRVERDTMP